MSNQIEAVSVVKEATGRAQTGNCSWNGGDLFILFVFHLRLSQHVCTRRNFYPAPAGGASIPPLPTLISYGAKFVRESSDIVLFSSHDRDSTRSTTESFDELLMRYRNIITSKQVNTLELSRLPIVHCQPRSSDKEVTFMHHRLLSFHEQASTSSTAGKAS